MAAMRRSLSSCLDATRMWRRTERASLEKKPSMRLSQEPCLGVKVNSDRCAGWPASQALVSLEICVEKLEEFDEFTAAMAILDQRMDLAGDEVDAGQQADRAVALIFMLPCEGRVDAGLGRQVRGGRRDRLDTRLLVVRDDRHRVARRFLRCRRGLLQESHLTINAQHFGHLCRKVGITLFQVVSHFMRLHLFLAEDLAYRALRQIGEACMSLRRPMLASVAGQKSRRPQFVGIAEVLRLSARQRHQPSLGLQRDRRFPAGARAIVERSHRAFGHGAFDAALDRLMMQSERPAYRKKRRALPIGQQYPCPLDPACRLGSRLRYRSQLPRIRISERQFNRPPPRCHNLPPRSIFGSWGVYRNPNNRDESPEMTTFMESVV